jgi:magnesium transporter
MKASKFMKKRSGKAGLSPGTLVYIGDKRASPVVVKVMDYTEQNYVEKTVKNVDECFQFKDTPSTSWINVDGIHEMGIVEKIGKHYDIHPLILEDIVNTGQRPKIEDFGDYIFIVMNILTYDEKTKDLDAEQVSFILREDCLITFKESNGKNDVFEEVRVRIRNGKGRVRRMGTDYLAYTLIDSIVDNYFTILEKMGEDIDSLEDTLISNSNIKCLKDINKLKKELLFVRKAIWPLREVLGSLERSESSLIKKKTKIYLKDVYDHIIQVIDMVEALRDILSEMIDIYLSSISNTLPEVMKVLTIISTIFIPLTFLAGVYGMNFKFMPELEHPFGYPAILLLMGLVAVAMLVYFKLKKWF